MAKKDLIVSITDGGKVVIKWDRLGEVLTKEEKMLMNRMLGKLQDHQLKLDKGKANETRSLENASR